MVSEVLSGRTDPPFRHMPQVSMNLALTRNAVRHFSADREDATLALLQPSKLTLINSMRIVGTDCLTFRRKTTRSSRHRFSCLGHCSTSPGPTSLPKRTGATESSFQVTMRQRRQHCITRWRPFRKTLLAGRHSVDGAFSAALP